MKKRIIRTLATMVLVVSVIMPGAQGTCAGDAVR